MTKKCRVFQFHSRLCPSVTPSPNSMFYVQELLRDLFHSVSEIFVEHMDPRLSHRLSLIGQFRPRPDDVLIIHHSMGHDISAHYNQRKCRKILLLPSTSPPAHFYDVGVSHAAICCDRPQATGKTLPGLRRRRHRRFGIQLRRASLGRGYQNPVAIPVLRDVAPVAQPAVRPGARIYFEEPRHQLLFVGPNQSRTRVIFIWSNSMRRYADAFEPAPVLHLRGEPQSRGGSRRGSARRDRAGRSRRPDPGSTGHVSEEELYGHYRAADAFVWV